MTHQYDLDKFMGDMGDFLQNYLKLSCIQLFYNVKITCYTQVNISSQISYAYSARSVNVC